MRMRPRVLMLSPEPPYPAAGGGALRTASLVEYLGRRCDLDLALFQVAGEADPRPEIPAGLVRESFLLPLRALSRRQAARVARNAARLARGVPPLVDRFSGQEAGLDACLGAKRYEIGLIEHFWCAPYLSVLARRCRRMILDLHNIESVWHERMARSTAWPLSWGHRVFARRCRRMEGQLLNRFDGVLVTSAADQRLLPAGIQSAIYPNAIPFTAVPKRGKQAALIFSGNLEYEPNRQALRFFHSRVWPLVQRRWPELEWRILGKNPNAAPRKIRDDPRVFVLGPVSNAIEEIAKAQAAIVPVLSGSGTRVKILEAWAAGVPVVSTKLGAEGLGAAAGVELLLADRPEDFAASITKVLEDPALARGIGSAGRSLYERKFTWDAAWEVLDKMDLLQTVSDFGREQSADS